VYFEEWGDPIITGIRWVSELVEIAGGIDVFPELREKSLAKDRIVGDQSEVIRRAPEVIIGSWCGRKFQKDRVRARAGWEAIPAVQRDALFEIKSSLILQPGPAALTDGLDAISEIIATEAARP
jgi:iron complex transport system substrate-binding protein